MPIYGQWPAQDDFRAIPSVDQMHHDRRAMGEPWAALSARLDDLEFHRAFDVDERLEGAIELGRAALEAGLMDLRMRAVLVEADMRLRRGEATEASALAMEVNRWADANGPVSLLARSHLILSSIFESVGDASSGLDHAIRGLELLSADAAPRTRGNFLLRLADALAVAGSLDAARERYREALRYFREVDDIERQMGVLNNLSYAESESGESTRALVAAEEMRVLADRNSVALPPPLLDTLARTYIGVGDLDKAAIALESGLRALTDRGNVEADTPAGLMLTLADVQLSQGRLGAAQTTIDRCRAVCAKRNLRGAGVDLLRLQSEVYAAGSRFELAYQTHREFHAAFLELHSMRREANARTRQALFETAEARQDAERFWRQARTDALTGIPNRRFLDEELEHDLADAAAGASIVVAIVDADHFKRVNDTFSHDVGDQVIRELAQVLEAALPPAPDPAAPRAAYVARLGGEEFLIVLRGLDGPTAAGVLEGARIAVASHPWHRRIGTLGLTVSIGSTTAHAGDSPSSVLARADHNLYGAKAAGRNRVIGESGREVRRTTPRRPPASNVGASAGAARRLR